ncbi:hypothetical protein GE21DRAFT_9641 [Neurospora crassa]|uniref:Uncharacterized protein n=2 Tax=Neurospora TaxID=5140 RepID=Q7S0Q6_NEUCR|nr:uncharacterized protein NEUTE1DRAFT_47017 [Neurospora tetrasperma FGSC 2508]XP_958145.2 hypothetical protein NCU09293 [Neurospora crassa OR74A]EGZ69844.1 hypothetical protein NEUTE2DRAFT_72408 [Neurospora tetrasperma FGSC 2509]KAK3486275.1 hypothetical protein B0T13DRAFT_484199 [Neurospora crassa]EAA28909.2 hypothetical protein NCU09293 [Neurospora crassa OR74A]EGO54965.1 hypothetical protein NEUTE1DRAFT_47017 [Neurospora tetrasperma FGSC 2508]KHE80394.1 hypothetical protein GE21DRAFT_9641|eukprot:XP_958145.2 hypothetical protein NCU09293 [Neurospora crassa OR74A]
MLSPRLFSRTLLRPRLTFLQARGSPRQPVVTKGQKKNIHKKREAEDDFGGPGGQELYPWASAVHRKYATRTAVGVAATCAVLYTSKMLERKGFFNQPGDRYVLTHDNTKGELGDVMMLRVRNGQVV